MTDRQLLERFVTRHEEAAFAALVQRHGPPVLGICRRLLRCEHDAEDVCQATFLVLARKAAIIPWQESVDRWLCVVARRLSQHRPAVAQVTERVLARGRLVKVREAHGQEDRAGSICARGWASK